MSEEEIKTPETEEGNPNEDEFLDEKPLPVVPEVVPEPEPEPAPEPKKEEVPAKPTPDHYDYDDVRLENIEKARILWNKGYRKLSTIKFFVAIGILVIIVIGWIVPTTVMKDAGAVPMYIALGIAGVGIVGLLIFSLFQKKADKKGIEQYFTSYYGNLNDYVFDGMKIENLQGAFDTKVSAEEVEACFLYPGATNVGSRESLTFTYKNMDCALADVAVQKAASRGLQTVFVGKYLRTHNTLDFEGVEPLIIYFKGNDRAIPPIAIAEKQPIEESAKYAVYGPASLKPVLTRELKKALNQINTNALLVDVAISIMPGRTYWALGYEDDLMVLPSQNPFNPEFVMQYKEELRMILDIALMMNAPKQA